MLLQGFACDAQSSMPCAPMRASASAPGANTSSAGLTLASPPASPPQLSAPNTLGNLFSTCRSLQALLASPPPPPPSSYPVSSSTTSLTPPLAHAPSPMKLRLRSRKDASDSNNNNNNSSNNRNTPPTPSSAKRIVKRQPVRGANKRRRAADDDAGRGDVDAMEAESESSADEQDIEAGSGAPFALQLLAPSPLRRYPQDAPHFTSTTTVTPVPFNLPSFSPSSSSSSARPTTPKRARIAPDALPLGLERADFHSLHTGGVPDGSSRAHIGTDVEREGDGADWSVEDDRMLVELVLEKLRLSKEEWQDCARTLGKDRASLGRRWKSLVLHGDVGFKAGRARGKIHGTWR
ncbi:dna-binding protein [Ophiostoma piceae UAMH 11346]|uniref:Dna-binding protein n=1 Tax=Ophiostoma piceae (strain UAMH 11346) TaxID=1262450 RepID=S3D3E2_OPHP1|nr:dna-binding protein [Ophiostoma piceae UAMH 11346]